MSYVSELRNLVGHLPLQLPGSGVMVYRHREGEAAIEMLLQFRSDYNKYGLLGGGIESGESYEQCAVRELEEEAAIRVNPEELVLRNVYAGKDHITVYPNGDIVYHTVVVYSWKYSEDAVLAGATISSETKSLKWLTVDEIKKLMEEDAEKYFFHNNIPIFRDIVGKFFQNIT